MFALDFLSGIAVLVVAASALSPYWWPSIKLEFDGLIASNKAFVASIPKRRAKALSHWRGTEDDREKLAILAVLTAIGAGWLIWTTKSGIPAEDEHPWFGLLFMAIFLGTLLCGACAVIYAGGTIAWVWEGFWADDRVSLPVVNPMNRVGVASPLGEARFATAAEVDSALNSRGGHFVPPKFRD